MLIMWNASVCLSGTGSGGWGVCVLSQLTFNYATAVAASEAPTVTEKNNVKIIVELW